MLLESAMACGLYNERERRKNGKRIKMGREKWEGKNGKKKSLSHGNGMQENDVLTFLAEKRKC